MTNNQQENPDLFSDSCVNLSTYEALKPKERSFVDMYLMYWNGTKAAIYAGYAKGGATIAACKMLSNSTIKAAIAERRAQIKEQNAVDHEQITDYLTGVLTCGIHELLVQNIEGKNSPKPGNKITTGTLSLESFEELKASGVMRYVEAITIGKHGVTIKIFSKQAAIEMLARHKGYFEADNLQRNKNGDEGVTFYIPENFRGAQPEPGPVAIEIPSKVISTSQAPSADNTEAY